MSILQTGLSATSSPSFTPSTYPSTTSTSSTKVSPAITPSPRSMPVVIPQSTLPSTFSYPYKSTNYNKLPKLPTPPPPPIQPTYHYYSQPSPVDYPSKSYHYPHHTSNMVLQPSSFVKKEINYVQTMPSPIENKYTQQVAAAATATATSSSNNQTAYPTAATTNMNMTPINININTVPVLHSQGNYQIYPTHENTFEHGQPQPCQPMTMTMSHASTTSHSQCSPAAGVHTDPTAYQVSDQEMDSYRVKRLRLSHDLDDQPYLFELYDLPVNKSESLQPTFPPSLLHANSNSDASPLFPTFKRSNSHGQTHLFSDYSLPSPSLPTHLIMMRGESYSTALDHSNHVHVHNQPSVIDSDNTCKLCWEETASCKVCMNSSSSDFLKDNVQNEVTTSHQMNSHHLARQETKISAPKPQPHSDFLTRSITNSICNNSDLTQTMENEPAQLVLSTYGVKIKQEPITTTQVQPSSTNYPSHQYGIPYEVKDRDQVQGKLARFMTEDQQKDMIREKRRNLTINTQSQTTQQATGVPTASVRQHSLVSNEQQGSKKRPRESSDNNPAQQQSSIANVASLQPIPPSSSSSSSSSSFSSSTSSSSSSSNQVLSSELSRVLLPSDHVDPLPVDPSQLIPADPPAVPRPTPSTSGRDRQVKSAQRLLTAADGEDDNLQVQVLPVYYPFASEYLMRQQHLQMSKENRHPDDPNKGYKIRLIRVVNKTTGQVSVYAHGADVGGVIERKSNISRLFGKFESPSEKLLMNVVGAHNNQKGQSSNILTVRGVKRFLHLNKMKSYLQYKKWVETVLLPRMLHDPIDLGEEDVTIEASTDPNLPHVVPPLHRGPRPIPILTPSPEPQEAHQHRSRQQVHRHDQDEDDSHANDEDDDDGDSQMSYNDSSSSTSPSTSQSHSSTSSPSSESD